MDEYECCVGIDSLSSRTTPEREQPRVPLHTSTEPGRIRMMITPGLSEAPDDQWDYKMKRRGFSFFSRDRKWFQSIWRETHAAPLNELRTSSPRMTSDLSQKLGEEIKSTFHRNSCEKFNALRKSNNERQVVPASDKAPNRKRRVNSN